ncbi:beta-ketoacyl-ACP synthase II [Rhodocytophaga aerolata]|uniref:3-oxoacyl-[acyl-carrier-protein] synthase 2 n=1 Tax=Rhodocytophaga aerolata TaxID=455078 RepID=A0ABT8R735_9BACT|nr:beta-ketoacyl-ACP synthase II [Rhodocytophaga aerolata]MDO1447491.1 beta-ketoacyl-ACP synthase II [Rhodocytophaga aerolata]
MQTRRVVITGLGAITPIGNNYQTFFENLLKGKTGVGPITKFDPTHFKTKFACEVKDFDPLAYFDSKEARKLDLYSQYAMATAAEALQVSGLDLEKVDKDRFGVIWGSGNGGFKTFEEQIAEFTENNNVPRFNPFFIAKMLVNMAGGHISIKYGLRGVNYCTVSACASSTHALIDAFNYIKWNKADLFIAGGSEAPVTMASIGGFNAMKALSTNNENYQVASRPFDADRDGFVMGEGSGALILEEYEHARRRGATILAEIVGGGMSADGYHMTATHPEGAGAYLGMKMALEEAGIPASKVDYVNAHATSTPLGDVSELKAIYNLFKNSLDTLNISATKSMTGHLLGAAGAIEAIASVMSVYQDAIPPTMNTANVDPEIPRELNLTLGKAVKKEVRYALSNTFGFGGHNATLLVKKFEE